MRKSHYGGDSEPQGGEGRGRCSARARVSGGHRAHIRTQPGCELLLCCSVWLKQGHTISMC